MKSSQLLEYIIKPKLAGMDKGQYSGKQAEILLLATSAQETNCGYTVHQTHGPALGVFQCEPNTHKAVLRWVEEHAPQALVSLASDDDRLIYDLYYATAIARMLYYSIPQPLPAVDMDEMWSYYKSYYNRGGKATYGHWMINWNHYVKPVLS